METDAGFVARMRVALAGYETNSTGTRPLVRRGDTDRLCDLAEEVGRLRWVEQAARAISWLSVDNVQAVAPIERVRELNAALAAAQQEPADG